MQGGFRRRMRVEYYIEIVNVRMDDILVTVVDTEKTYDRVNRNNCFK